MNFGCRWNNELYVEVVINDDERQVVVTSEGVSTVYDLVEHEDVDDGE